MRNTREFNALGIELLEEIGRGGMGIVHKARQARLNRHVAVKFISANSTEERTRLRERVDHEAAILGRLSHPSIVACHHAGFTEDERAYLVMEYIDGPSLKFWVEERGRLREVVALRVVQALTEALAYAWSHGVIHCDIKAENCLLQSVGSGVGLAKDFPYLVKLADLGLARCVAADPIAEGITVGSYIMGTPYYMSPEQLDGEPLDFRSDIYSLGVLLYYITTGQLPYRQKSIPSLHRAKTAKSHELASKLNAELGAKTEALLEWMMQPKPEDRPKGYEELLVAVTEALEQAHQASAATLKNGRGKASDKGRSKWILGMAAAGAVAAAGIGLTVGVAMPTGDLGAENGREFGGEPRTTALAQAAPAAHAQQKPAPVPPPMPASRVILNEVVIDSSGGNPELEFFELKTSSPNQSLEGLSLVLIQGETDLENEPPGTVIRRFDFEGQDRSDSQGLFLLSNGRTARSYGVQPQLAWNDGQPVTNDSMTVILCASEGAPALRSVVPLGPFPAPVLDMVALTAPGSGVQIFYNAPTVGPDGEHLAAGAIRLSNEDQEERWILASIDGPPSTLNTPGKPNEVPSAAVGGAMAVPAYARLLPGGPMVASAPGAWERISYDRLFERVREAGNAVVCLAVEGDPASQVLEQDVLADPLLAELAQTQPLLYVPLEPGQSAQAMRTFSLKALPAVMVRQEGKPLRLLTLSPSTRAREVADFARK